MYTKLFFIGRSGESVFGIGFGEFIFIAVIALIFIGPQKLPDVARQAGRAFVRFRRMTSDVRHTFDSVIRQAEDEIRREEREAMRQVLSAADAPPPAAPEGAVVQAAADEAVNTQHENPPPT